MRFRGFLASVFACAFAVCACVCVRVCTISKFHDIDGQRTFYLDSASSQALIKRSISLADLPRVKGESVSFFVQNQNPDSLAKDIAKRYGAQILFTERTGDILSYYAFSPELGAGVIVQGVPVNLHIAIANDRGAVGSPLIFGGF